MRAGPPGSAARASPPGRPAPTPAPTRARAAARRARDASPRPARRRRGPPPAPPAWPAGACCGAPRGVGRSASRRGAALGTGSGESSARAGTEGRPGAPESRPGTLPRPMTGLDWILAGAALLLALFGWAPGFVSAALALVGFAIGAWIGTRVGPALVPGGRESPWAPAFGLLGALIAGGILAAGFEGIGGRGGRALRGPRR